MATQPRSLLIVIVLLAFAALACANLPTGSAQPTAPAVVSDPAQPTAVQPTAAQPTGATLRQWASRAEATTQYGEDAWSASQTTGAPNTPECGDFTTAWAAAQSNTVETLTVYYDTPVYVTQVNIHQSYNPNFVYTVDYIDMDDAVIPAYIGGVGVTESCPYVLTITGDGPTDFLVQAVRITLDQTSAPSWNEIDAVELVGLAP